MMEANPYITGCAIALAIVCPESDILQGNKVRSGVTTLEGLAKGIYIVNGRKMVSPYTVFTQRQARVSQVVGC